MRWLFFRLARRYAHAKRALWIANSHANLATGFFRDSEKRVEFLSSEYCRMRDERDDANDKLDAANEALSGRVEDYVEWLQEVNDDAAEDAALAREEAAAIKAGLA